MYDNSYGRTHLTKDTRLFLEKVFAQKQWLTKEERQLIARKCGLSPLQVRIWVC
ncbi:homeobox domain-containing protein PWA37_004399 [Arxiozyma heterogenica]